MHYRQPFDRCGAFAARKACLGCPAGMGNNQKPFPHWNNRACSQLCHFAPWRRVRRMPFPSASTATTPRIITTYSSDAAFDQRWAVILRSATAPTIPHHFFPVYHSLLLGHLLGWLERTVICSQAVSPLPTVLQLTHQIKARYRPQELLSIS